MTGQQAAEFLLALQAAYPGYYARFGEKEAKGLTKAWSGILADYSYEESIAGLQMFLAADIKGFPPSPGQVIDCIQRARRSATEDYTNTECADLIRRALSNAVYHAEEEFERLPEICKRAVGTPHNLVEWSQLDTREVETVVMSQIIRALEAVRIRMREDAKIPESVKRALGLGAGRDPLYKLEQVEREQRQLKAKEQPSLPAPETGDEIAEAVRKIMSGEASLADTMQDIVKGNRLKPGGSV
jgi:hypothetical protein|nr:MAG TPA: replisome organizer [Caudoviricetes sp.]